MRIVAHGPQVNGEFYKIILLLPSNTHPICFSVLFEPPHDKTNKMACVPKEDSDQPGHLPSLIRVFTVCMKEAWVLSYPLSAQWRLWSDWADAQADLSLHWVHTHFVAFVMRRLIFFCLLSRCLKSEGEFEKVQAKALEFKRKLDDSQAALQEIGRENQSLQVLLLRTGISLGGR